MKTVYRLLGTTMLWALLVVGIAPAPTAAAPRAQAVPISLGGDGAAQPIDVVVLLDDSGSMATCWPWPKDRPPFSPPCGPPSNNLPSDPNALRYSAARLLLQLLDADDRVAVVRFDSEAAGVGSLGTLQPIGSAENRSQLIAALQEPESYFERGYTRIDLGLDAAIQLLTQGREPGRSQYVLLLTDGEPSEQAGVSDQKPRIIQQFDTLANDEVLTFPVVLCNPTAGCAGEFLRDELAASFAGGVQEAASAPDLLRIFSELLADMKPDRSIITGRDGAGALQLATRAAHGVQQLAYVTPSGNLLSVKRDGNPVLPDATLRDPNIDVNVVAGEDLAAGRWTANTLDRSGFVIVQADSYPQLLNPPPSVANSPASIRYYPAGNAPLLIARGTGPGADEPLFLQDVGEFIPLGSNGQRALLADDPPATLRIQLGNDQEPLQLVRSFRLAARADLPQAEIFAPLGDDVALANGRLPLQVGFGGGADVTKLAATVYVTDESNDDQGNGRLVYEAIMQCVDRLCSDADFAPQDGRSYAITYVVQGEQDGVRFSDWTRTELGLAPAVYLRGLPAELDLAQMPADGWPVEIAAGAVDPIGSLTASIVLRDAETGESLPGVTLDFNQDVPEDGSLNAGLKVKGLEALRPGDYVGEIALAATTPSGLPMDVDIRPGPSLPVTLSVARPLAQAELQSLDFGAVQFETSPNFRLNQASELPVRFAGNPFALTVELAESTCPQITVSSGELRAEEERFVLPLTLTSSEPVPPGSCQGMLALTGPNDDYDVTPALLAWRSRVDAVEWSLAGSDLNLGDLQDAGARAEGTLLLRFNGQTPFVVTASNIDARGVADDGEVVLGDADLEVPPIEVTGEPNEFGLYEVPISVVARSRIPHDPMRGSFYSGDLAVRIEGLPGAVQTAGFSFRSPSLAQRYIMPVLRPIYGMPMGLLTVPLTLLLLLVLLARIRGRDIDDDAIEEAAMAAAMQMNTTPSQGSASAPPPFVPVSAPGPEQVWGSSEWGLPWQGTGASAQESGPAPDKGGDPWSVNW